MTGPKAWAKQELEWLLLHYPTASPEQTKAALPGRAQGSIYAKASKMGIRKTNPLAYINAPQSKGGGVPVITHVIAKPISFKTADDPRNILQQELYDGAELLPSERPGANDFAQWPSVMGGWRIWRDGRRERIEQ